MMMRSSTSQKRVSIAPGHHRELDARAPSAMRLTTVRSFATTVDHRYDAKYLWVKVAQKVTLVLIGAMIWGTVYFCVGDEAAGFNSELFTLLMFFVSAKCGGWLFSLIRIPGLLGMLVVGVLFKTFDLMVLDANYMQIASLLRVTSLINLLLAAGLGLSLTSMRNMSLEVLMLAIIPSTVEVLIMTIISKYYLDVPWLWASLMGLMLGAVSPSVVVPCLFHLQQQGYGVDKDVHSLLVGATTLNDIISITLFGINLGLVFETGRLSLKLMEGPVGIVNGVIFGIILGFTARCFPDQHDPFVEHLRTAYLLTASIFATIMFESFHFSCSGPLGCIIGSMIAASAWRKIWNNPKHNPVKENFHVIWEFLEPIAFGLIGFEIDLNVLHTTTVVHVTIAMSFALLSRVAIASLVPIRLKYNYKEMLFVGIAWLPKATVQATIGPVALDHARKEASPENIEYASTVLMVAVMSIIITAPVGTILMLGLGPKLLRQTSVHDRIGDTNVAHLEHNNSTDFELETFNVGGGDAAIENSSEPHEDVLV